MKKVLAIVVILPIIGACCVKDAPDPIGDSYLESGSYTEVSEEITDWLNQQYSTDYREYKVNIKDTVRFDGELSLIDSYQVPIIPIPEGMKIDGYPNPEIPIEFYVFIFKAENGEVFLALVSSPDNERYRVITFGQAVDHRVNQDPIALETWPVQELQNEANDTGAQLIMIPYPFAVDQLYYQYGEDLESSRLVNVETGLSYNGIGDLTTSVTVDPSKL